MRPCDTCQGSGVGPMDEIEGVRYVDEPCPSCVDMPWLPRFLDTGGLVPLGVEPFKPDPESVMRWCFTHTSGATPDHSACYSRYAASPNTRECEFGWVPAITQADRLEEA